MNFLIEKFCTELIYHEPNSNQFNLVCDRILQNFGVFNTNFDTALISLFPRSLTGKANGLFYKMLIQQIYPAHKSKINLTSQVFY